MRVGLVVPGFSAEPADWCIPALRHLVRQLAATDDVVVFSLRYPYRPAMYTIDGARVVALGGARRRGAGTLGVWRATFEALRAAHRERAFDVLHAFWATESGLLAAVVGRALGIPSLVSVAGGELARLPQIGYGDQLRSWERLKVGASLHLAGAVSGGSWPLVRLVERHVPSSRRVARAPLGVDRRLFHAASAPLGGAPPESSMTRGPSRQASRGASRDGPGVSQIGRSPHLLHVGTLTPVKDQACLLRAFALLRQHVPCARLHVVGDGPLRPRLEHLAGQLGVADAVCFHGDLDHAQLPAVYAAADVFVLSSLHEAQGMVVLEAAACGTPSVGTAVGALAELAPRAARAVPAGDAVALADTLRALLEDSGDRARVAEAARARVAADFSLEGCTARFRRLYVELAGH